MGMKDFLDSNVYNLGFKVLNHIAEQLRVFIVISAATSRFQDYRPIRVCFSSRLLF